MLSQDAPPQLALGPLAEAELAALCVALIGDTAGLSQAEWRLVEAARPSMFLNEEIEIARQAIRLGADPLGEAFAVVRSAPMRRSSGAIYTPELIVRAMLQWLVEQGRPARVVDPGAGSGRFILAAAAALVDAELVAIEKDPLAALMLRANLAVRGLAERATVLVDDYRHVRLPEVRGTTAFIGNPPYVRHHDIGAEWKSWYAERFARFGIKASALAGLHIHFFLQTRLLAQRGDVGAFVTSAEWMDVNYGAALRRLMMEELGGIALHMLSPTVEAFPGTATTAAITCFRVGEKTRPVRVRCVDDPASLSDLQQGIDVPRERLQAAPKWSLVVRPSTATSEGDIELGELFRVHRGQVTGANEIWIAGEQAHELPKSVCVPAVTRAKELIEAGSHLRSADELRRVVDLPAELDAFEADERARIDRFLKWAKRNGADAGYIARHRRSWWSVGLKAPAPILCTYMARRAPQFTLNACRARHINVAHGLYPRAPIAVEALPRLVAWLNGNVATSSGRTYAGGLTKFEPKEIERLRIPALDRLAA